MSVSHEEILEACRPILEMVGFHVTETRHERRFITAYQIWFELEQAGHPICQRLIEACRGSYVGNGAGSQDRDGPAKRIADALGHRPQVETQYLYTKFSEFHGREPSGPDCGLFRLRS